ncbi:dpy-30-like protein-like protein [Phlyctochytrium arcticum]|nr:dpy-30-like protein-like protein [Phlyctochytrium arcticum]
MAERADTGKLHSSESAVLLAPASEAPTHETDTVSKESPHEAFGLSKELLEIIESGRQSIMTKDQVQALPLRSYLDHTVVPVLVEGLKALARERPPNPCEYLAVFLLKNGGSRKTA